jgi:hypothetical protein
VLEREGEGWRLAWDGQRHPFAMLIGGENWASELTAAEGQALFRAMEALRDQHSALVGSLMEEETICLEFQTCTEERGGELWVALEGDRQDWMLRFVLQPGPGQRGLEGGWSRHAAAGFLQAYSNLLAPAIHGPVTVDP